MTEGIPIPGIIYSLPGRYRYTGPESATAATGILSSNPKYDNRKQNEYEVREIH